jgi:hypothetical protein
MTAVSTCLDVNESGWFDDGARCRGSWAGFTYRRIDLRATYSQLRTCRGCWVWCGRGPWCALLAHLSPTSVTTLIFSFPGGTDEQRNRR